ncbi:MAG: response regulator [Pseudomonadota bacterium]
MHRTIAYVEDDPTILANYAELLRDEGFTVNTFDSKESAVASFRQALPDLALLDLSLHGERDAGYHLCSELRSLSSRVPIIFLTSHDSDIDKISGLRLGADDYITKDASIDLIVVRIEALFRRLEALQYAQEATQLDVRTAQRSVQLDDAYSRVFYRGVDLGLSLTHYWIVQSLCTDPGKVKSHRDLKRACNIVVEDNTITAHIKSIRRAFAAVDATFDCIKTERGLGYRWIPEP